MFEAQASLESPQDQPMQRTPHKVLFNIFNSQLCQKSPVGCHIISWIPVACWWHIFLAAVGIHQQVNAIAHEPYSSCSRLLNQLTLNLSAFIDFEQTDPSVHHFSHLLDINPLESRGNYSATSNSMKLVHWPLMGGLLYWVGLGGLQPRPVPSSL